MTAAVPSPSVRPSRKWFALAVLAGSQLLIVLDATVVNVALTDIRTDLGLDPAELHWVITGYVLAFGGFLLLGGRLADRLGRRRVFVVGAAAFGVGSALAALADSAIPLFLGRGVQGLAAAVLAPSALALLMSVFGPGRERNTALGVWGAVSASGTTLGLIVGGALTQTMSWRWVFWINVPIVAAALLGAVVCLPGSRAGSAERFDVAGAVLATGGLGGLVYGLVQAAEAGWAAPLALPVVAVAAAMLIAFARLQSVRPYALVPTRLLRNPTVLGANLVGLVLGAAIYALFYVVSLFMGAHLHYGAIATGLAFLPMAVTIAVASTISSRLLGRVGARPLLVASAVLTAVALASLIRISPDATYVELLLPAFVLAGLGLGIAFVALTTAAVGSAPSNDSGIAAAVFSAGQQIGGAIGLAVLTAVSTARTRGLAALPEAEAITQGWSLAFVVAAGMMLAGLTITLVMIKPVGPSR
ncbi:MFS transporter [Actinomycetes bacterium KLBMP 9759]